MLLETAGKWVAGKLLNVAWDSACEIGKRPEVLNCFEAACVTATKEFPELFPEYTADALSVSPDGETLADRLQDTFGTRDFPRPRELSEMLISSWRRRKAALSSAEAAPLFQKPETEISPFITRLSELFFRELANSDRLRNPFVVSVLQEMLDAFLQVGSRSSGLGLWAVNGIGMNVVRGVEGNDQPNGEFRFHTAFQLLPGNDPIDLFQFEGTYWANGCPCLNLEPSLLAGDTRMALLPDDRSLKQPIRLAPSGISIRYSRALRPPLQKDIPEDCDYGDLKITLSYREASAHQVVTEERIFRYLPGGVLEPAAAIRPVARLSDEELRAHLSSGDIDNAAFDRLIAIDPVRRYMGSRSDVGENFVPDRHDLNLLRKLLNRRPTNGKRTRDWQS